MHVLYNYKCIEQSACAVLIHVLIRVSYTYRAVCKMNLLGRILHYSRLEYSTLANPTIAFSTILHTGHSLLHTHNTDIDYVINVLVYYSCYSGRASARVVLTIQPLSYIGGA